MQLNEIQKIIKENQEVFDILENYDKTGKLPFQRQRIDITLSVETLEKLNEINKKTSKPLSYIIEDKLSDL